jgi:hypothetical protein
MNMTSIRRWHSYVGFFIAPSVFFFSITGAAQLFSLHEAHGNYHPAAIVEKLSSVHKDQVFEFGDHHESDSTDSGELKTAPKPDATPDEHDKPAISTLLLKCFFLLIALCLSLSTALGLWMGLTQPNRQRIGWLLLIAGALIPTGLLVL